MPDDEEARRAPARRGSAALWEVMRRTHLCSPTDLVRVVRDEAMAAGALGLEVYLVDHEQGRLIVPSDPGAGAHVIDGTIPGRCFGETTIIRVPLGDGGDRVWVPLLDGTARLGVMSVDFAAADLDAAGADGVIAVAERYAHLVAMLVVTKGAYGDVFDIARRRAPMSIAAELVWSLAPPMVFATDDLTVAGLLEPAYDNGGDALDYAVDDGTLRFAVFDAMGHGLAAAGTAAFAISAYRHSRRLRHDLATTHATMRAAVAEHVADGRFVTALIAELDIAGGRLGFVCAGHPPPLVIRAHRHAFEPGATPALPLGVDGHDEAVPVQHVQLQRGDRVLAYSDGLLEARMPGGATLGRAGLAGFVERETNAEKSGPETLRRLRRALIDGAGAELRDDASALLITWGGGDEHRLLPQTVAEPGL